MKNIKGTVYKRGDKYAFQFSYSVLIDNIQTKKKMSIGGFDTREEATIKLNQAILDFKENGIDDFDRKKHLPTKKILKLYSYEYVEKEYIKYKKSYLKSSSFQVELTKLNNVRNDLKGKFINDINKLEFLRNYAETEPLYKARTLREILNFCVNSLEIIQDNKLNKIKLKNKNENIKKDKIYSKDELKIIFNSNNEDFNLFCKFLYYTGMRKGELLALNYSDIILYEDKIKVIINKSFYNGKITSTKTENSNREIEIPPFLYKNIIEYKTKNKKIKESSLIFDKRCLVIPIKIKKSIKNFNFHKFRHTHTTELVKANVPLKDIQYRLGHSTTKTTLEIYSHYVKFENNNIANILKEL